MLGFGALDIFVRGWWSYVRTGELPIPEVDRMYTEPGVFEVRLTDVARERST
jgi:hypothetical protein